MGVVIQLLYHQKRDGSKRSTVLDQVRFSNLNSLNVIRKWWKNKALTQLKVSNRFWTKGKISNTICAETENSGVQSNTFHLWQKQRETDQKRTKESKNKKKKKNEVEKMEGNWKTKQTCKVAHTATAKGTQLEREKTHLSIDQATRTKGIRNGRRGFSAIKWWKNSIAPSPLKKPPFRPLGPPSLVIWNETQKKSNHLLRLTLSPSLQSNKKKLKDHCEFEKSKSENLRKTKIGKES